MLKKQFYKTTAACLMAVASSLASAHVNIATENLFSLGDDGREYLEGKSAFISLNLPHSCSDANRNHYPTTDVVLILPNSMALSADFYTKNRHTGEMYPANAVMGTKARVSRNWRKVKVVKGNVSPFYSHGLKDTDTRAIKWLGGHVDNDHYDNLEIKTKFPKIDPASCVGELRVEMPAIQYCKEGYVTAWIGTTGSARFPQDGPKLRLEETYVPYFKVVRDVTKNPYPANCAVDDQGNVIAESQTIRPTDADIDIFGGRDRHEKKHKDDKEDND
ncbi:DUF1775 domain-containing protein [methane-oxidizing endosymbiont of Gigantopelta aegis]|uniref:DUF1775 domain-containing protein n=1 Tax=methane-oxidizing endosymbiont of Gigantopelta aegis TaxID=2794938 RepID=UPI0018DD24FD|nr:DUF1775 domain-containing protein [methane-oxidizing endosymbiont of Gigantopelta aegis]